MMATNSEYNARTAVRKNTNTSASKLVEQSKVIIFDCDDTLISTAKTRWVILIRVAATFGESLDEATIRAGWGLPFDKLIQTIVPNIPLEEFVTRYRTAMREKKPEVTRGAQDFLARLKSRGTRIEIVTSSRRDLIIQDLDELEMTDFFVNIYGHEQSEYHKPDPRVLEDPIRGLLDLDFKPTEITYIGDSVRDYLVSKGNNLQFIAVLSGLEEASDFEAAGVGRDRIVGSLRELLPYRIF